MKVLENQSEFYLGVKVISPFCKLVQKIFSVESIDPGQGYFSLIITSNRYCIAYPLIVGVHLSQLHLVCRIDLGQECVVVHLLEIFFVYPF